MTQNIGIAEILILLLILFTLVAVVAMAGIAIVMVVRRVTGKNPVAVERRERVHCPFCDELISPNAKVCPHCGRDLITE